MSELTSIYASEISGVLAALGVAEVEEVYSGSDADEVCHGPALVGSNPAFRHALRHLQAIVAGTSPVLILGETGFSSTR